MTFFKKGSIDDRLLNLEKEISMMKKLIRNIRAGDEMLKRDINHIANAVGKIDEVYSRISDQQRDLICQSKSKK